MTRTAKEVEESEARLEDIKTTLFAELKRRLPTESALDFLDVMKQLAFGSMTYEVARKEAHRILDGPLNMDLFHAFLKVCFSPQGTSK